MVVGVWDDALIQQRLGLLEVEVRRLRRRVRRLQRGSFLVRVWRRMFHR